MDKEKLHSVIKGVLEKDKEARENNEKLILKVLEKLGYAKINENIFGVEVRINNWDAMPSWGYIIKVKKYLQDRYPNLK